MSTPPTGGRLSQPEREAAGLSNAAGTAPAPHDRTTLPAPPAPSLTLPPPAVVVTVYNDLSGTRTAPLLDRLQQHAAPSDLAVCVHDPPGDDERRLTDLVTSRGLRLWYAWGVDPDVLRAPGEAAKVTERRARLAADRGAEVVELNGEARWKAGGLSGLAREMIAACREGAPGLPVSWTSFDHVAWHRLPRRAIAGPGGVDLLALQYYAADTRDPDPETHRDARARLTRAGAQLEQLVAAGEVRADLRPHAPGWHPYGQIHGLTTAGAVVVLDAADTVRAWALPTRCDEAGMVALCAVLAARRQHGRRAGAIGRAQSAAGLPVDGICGPQTLQALGL